MKNVWTKMDREILTEMIKSKHVNALDKCAILCELTKRGIHSSRVREAIAPLKNDNSVFWNTYLLSDFAYAALHLMGWEEYNGNREEIKRLISSQLSFL